MNKSTIIAFIVFILLIVGAIYFVKKDSSGNAGIPKEEVFKNVFVIEGKQIIEIKAKGGFVPRRSIAAAGLPTILRINTNGTFDCSAVVRIPKLNILQNLPLTGMTDIDLGLPEKGIMQGTCGMGMYPFEIEFS